MWTRGGTKMAITFAYILGQSYNSIRSSKVDQEYKKQERNCHIFTFILHVASYSLEA